MKTFFSLLVSLFLFVSVGAFGCAQPGNWTAVLPNQIYSCSNYIGSFGCQWQPLYPVQSGNGTVLNLNTMGGGNPAISNESTSAVVCAGLYGTWLKNNGYTN